MNRLKDATSPYLLQHADNPVAWWPWGAEALAEARVRQLPLLISVGYSACHWCHVMAHESFEDPETAALMNEHFVNVKVDREERPDIDAIYMEATQALTGHGGWPMTVFATPDGHPFFTGTYYPRPHFQRLLHGVAQAWRNERQEVVAQGAKIVSALAERGAVASGPRPDEASQALAVTGLVDLFDPVNGGFGAAPKFPPSMVLEFLLRRYARTGDRASLDMVEQTLAAMARGGIYDQLAGGFARYSVDASWVVPHFEKMLYDNALLLRVYTHWWRTTGAPLARRVALETADWLIAEMRTAEGGFASALDADSEGVEGKFYVWTPEQLTTVLGAEDGAYAASLFSVTDDGTFEHGQSVLQLPSDPTEADISRFERVKESLLTARAERVRPGRDDKIVAAWNGLAVAALAETGAVFERPDLIEAARDAAQLLADLHLADGRLQRTSKDGRVGTNAGVLDDYGDVAEGFIALYGVTGEARWIESAGMLLDTVLTRFPDGEGGFFDTADDAERLFRRPQDPTDNATPSGQFAAAGALLSYAALTGSARHREAAEAALRTVPVLGERHARFAGWGLVVAEAALAGPVEVAVVGPPGDARTLALHRAALLSDSPGLVIALGEPGAEPAVPLLAHRTPRDGEPAAYVCRGFTCRLPVTTPADLAAEITA
ncbi:thioredoxin domain-containing protein [Rhizohabitans arisaemae]|uniref:thioredoxin domain-containing protein n=1 Tax=Rhizohabitans arisaemae TaxID=2720610 RepID=UPI0024B11AE5|nr:thioredoxin domain-containing protein [Rhizohabitans arisaemae]